MILVACDSLTKKKHQDQYRFSRWCVVAKHLEFVYANYNHEFAGSIHKLWICDFLRLFHFNFFFENLSIFLLGTCISLTHQIYTVLIWFRLLHALVEFYANSFFFLEFR